MNDRPRSASTLHGTKQFERREYNCDERPTPLECRALVRQ